MERLLPHVVRENAQQVGMLYFPHDPQLFLRRVLLRKALCSVSVNVATLNNNAATIQLAKEDG